MPVVLTVLYWYWLPCSSQWYWVPSLFHVIAPCDFAMPLLCHVISCQGIQIVQQSVSVLYLLWFDLQYSSSRRIPMLLFFQYWSLVHRVCYHCQLIDILLYSYVILILTEFIFCQVSVIVSVCVCVCVCVCVRACECECVRLQVQSDTFCTINNI